MYRVFAILIRQRLKSERNILQNIPFGVFTNPSNTVLNLLLKLLQLGQSGQWVVLFWLCGPVFHILPGCEFQFGLFPSLVLLYQFFTRIVLPSPSLKNTLLPGCEFQFGLFPRGQGCHTSYTKCDMGVPSEVLLMHLIHLIHLLYLLHQVWHGRPFRGASHNDAV